jgi:hypothetical protein
MGLLGNLGKWLLPTAEEEPAREVTNNAILNELLSCFDNSCQRESVGRSLLFNMHFLIILHPETYDSRMQSLAPIVNEAVKEFYARLARLKSRYDELVPVSPVWHFKFGPAAEFNNESIRTGDIKVIGMLTGLKQNYSPSESVTTTTTKVTMRVKATNAYDRMEMNPQVFRHINFLDSGTFQIRFSPDLRLGGNAAQPTTVIENGIANIDYYIADKGQGGKYTMRDKEIVIARKEPENMSHPNYLLIDSPAVSNPHARIKYNDGTGKFQIASFSNNETRVNEVVINKSEPANPQWSDLPDNAQLLLNTIITLKFKSI